MVYTSSMRILLMPLILQKQADEIYYLSQSMIAVFNKNGHKCAVCAPGHYEYSTVTHYEDVPRRRPLLPGNIDERNYEEWLYIRGALSQNYLQKDLENTLDIIADFHPDLIITFHRAAAVIAAHLQKIPCWCVVNAAIYRNLSFDRKVMKGLNAVLYENHMEQEFSMRGFYEKCERRIVFGPLSLQPCRREDNITRIGRPFLHSDRFVRSNRVCIFFSETDSSPRKLHKLIEDTFLGAPYIIYAWYPGCEGEEKKNIRFLDEVQAGLIPGSIAVIHDGSTYFLTLAAALGVPQLMITDHSYNRAFNAMAGRRTGISVNLYEEEVSMSTLWEAYKRLLADDNYYNRAQDIKDEIFHMNDINSLHRLLTEEQS